MIQNNGEKRMNIKEKLISYGKEHPKDKNMVIAVLAVIIFVENIKKAIQSGVGKKGKRRLELAGGENMYEYEEQSGGYRTSIRNVEYNSEQVKKQLKPVNRLVVVPVALVCVAALAMTGITGKLNLPSKVNASESKNNLLVGEETEMNSLVQEVEAEVVAKTETQTQAYVEENVVIDNDALP